MDVKKRSSVASYCTNISPRPFYHTHNIFPSGYSNPEWCQSPKCYAMRGKVIFPQLLSSIHMVSDKYTQICVSEDTLTATVKDEHVVQLYTVTVFFYYYVLTLLIY